MNTLLLDQTAWDLVLDSNRNIALASPPYALAQDVASAVRLFLAELWYDTTQGIPYFQKILGQLPPSSLIVELIRKRVLSVPGVVTAQVFISSFNNREISGQIQFTDNTGTTTTVEF
jgi:hypothetical protein